jgi:hypothetical protein
VFQLGAMLGSSPITPNRRASCSSGKVLAKRPHIRKTYFFFEKKKQKTFAQCVRLVVENDPLGAAGKSQKLFGSFFQERTASLKARAPREAQRCHHATPGLRN